ncbi:MAG TPA: hypothetical protein VFP43_22045 [Mesorhizobium sp.]|nr:hypothetical protein [Mesorhizobium sp.]
MASVPATWWVFVQVTSRPHPYRGNEITDQRQRSWPVAFYFGGAFGTTVSILIFHCPLSFTSTAVRTISNPSIWFYSLAATASFSVGSAIALALLAEFILEHAASPQFRT